MNMQNSKYIFPVLGKSTGCYNAILYDYLWYLCQCPQVYILHYLSLAPQGNVIIFIILTCKMVFPAKKLHTNVFSLSLLSLPNLPDKCYSFKNIHFNECLESWSVA